MDCCIGSLFLPPGINLILMGLGFFLHHWWKWTGRLLMTASILSLYLLSLPGVGNRQLFLLQKETVLPQNIDWSEYPASAIVIFGAGRRNQSPEYDFEDSPHPLLLERLRYGAQLAKSLKFPLLLSGGGSRKQATPEAVVMNQVMVEDYDLEVSFLETKSQTALQKAQNSAKILKNNQLTTAILVTHAWNMKRARMLMEAQGIQVIPAAVGFVQKRPNYPYLLTPYLPSVKGLSMTVLAIRERFSLWYSFSSETETIDSQDVEGLSDEEDAVSTEDIDTETENTDTDKVKTAPETLSKPD